MTQITNVLYILLITIAMSVVATFLTLSFDRVIDVESFVKSIPHLVLTVGFKY